MSMSMMPRPFSFCCPLTSIFVFFSLFLIGVRGLVNVTVQRDDPGLVYIPKGEWSEEWPGVRTSQAAGANVTMNFTGVAVYYQAWLWTAPTYLVARVDGGAPVMLDLTDHARLGGELEDDVPVPTTEVVVLVASGMLDAQHTLVVSREADHRETIVGSFIYSTDNPPSPNPSRIAPSSSTPESQPSNSASIPTRPNADLKIILPAVLAGSITLAIIFSFVVFVMRRRRRNRVRQRGTWGYSSYNLNTDTGYETRGMKILPLHRPFTAAHTSKQFDLEPHIVVATPLDKESLFREVAN
ncbi:hypothetical protein CC2G_009900 [Coprinopsis cinerea AmutBmut pab1-1]|nr:hypothetical protein CC2G_009900 [Coprinopsis cinerea AmutBmut pab1-1]